MHSSAVRACLESLAAERGVMAPGGRDERVGDQLAGRPPDGTPTVLQGGAGMFGARGQAAAA